VSTLPGLSDILVLNLWKIADVGSYTYGLGHPMKPHRIRVTHDLVAAYDMLPKMHVLVGAHISFFVQHLLTILAQRPRRATPEMLTAFHTDEYIHFLTRVSPETAEELTYHGTRCERTKHIQNLIENLTRLLF